MKLELTRGPSAGLRSFESQEDGEDQAILKCPDLKSFSDSMFETASFDDCACQTVKE